MKAECAPTGRSESTIIQLLLIFGQLPGRITPVCVQIRDPTVLPAACLLLQRSQTPPTAVLIFGLQNQSNLTPSVRCSPVRPLTPRDFK
jgi:hypothetical protein